MGIKTTLLDRRLLRLRKFEIRVVSSVFSNNAKTQAVAESLLRQVYYNYVAWTRNPDLESYLPVHDYMQRVNNIRGDAYAATCDFGVYADGSIQDAKDMNQFSPRKGVIGMACYTIIVPKELKDPEYNINDADINSIEMNVIGDQWNDLGCYVVMALSDSINPPTYAEIIDNMNTPGREKEGVDGFAGFIGESPTDANAVRYLRTNAILNTNDQKYNGVNLALQNRVPEMQKVRFRVHEWGMNDVEDGHYKIKNYIHLIIFLSPEQYVNPLSTVSRYMLEGGASFDGDSIELATTDEVEEPRNYQEICPVNMAHAPTVDDFYGRSLNIFNIVKMTTEQSKRLKKNRADRWAWEAIERSLEIIDEPIGAYAIGEYPDVTLNGFDFYTVGADGREYVRVGCIDENFHDDSIEFPAPSVWGSLIVYPVATGLMEKAYDRVKFSLGTAHFSEAINLRVTLFLGGYSGITSRGVEYGYNPKIRSNISSTGGSVGITASTLFKGENTNLIFEDSYLRLARGGKIGFSMELIPLYSGIFTSLTNEQEIMFESPIFLETDMAFVVGIVPVSFTNDLLLNTEGIWGNFLDKGYGNNQYMQYVEWPLSGTISLNQIDA